MASAVGVVSEEERRRRVRKMEESMMCVDCVGKGIIIKLVSVICFFLVTNFY